MTSSFGDGGSDMHFKLYGAAASSGCYFFFSGEDRLDGSLTAIAQARSPPTVNDLSSPPCGYQLQGTRGAAGPRPVSDSNPISDVTFR